MACYRSLAVACQLCLAASLKVVDILDTSGDDNATASLLLVAKAAYSATRPIRQLLPC